jgi:hypothetical protein
MFRHPLRNLQVLLWRLLHGFYVHAAHVVTGQVWLGDTRSHKVWWERLSTGDWSAAQHPVKRKRVSLWMGFGSARKVTLKNINKNDKILLRTLIGSDYRSIGKSYIFKGSWGNFRGSDDAAEPENVLKIRTQQRVGTRRET